MHVIVHVPHYLKHKFLVGIISICNLWRKFVELYLFTFFFNFKKKTTLLIDTKHVFFYRIQPLYLWTQNMCFSYRIQPLYLWTQNMCFCIEFNIFKKITISKKSQSTHNTQFKYNYWSVYVKINWSV